MELLILIGLNIITSSLELVLIVLLLWLFLPKIMINFLEESDEKIQESKEVRSNLLSNIRIKLAFLLLIIILSLSICFFKQIEYNIIKDKNNITLYK
jgi:L-lactate permease